MSEIAPIDDPRDADENAPAFCAGWAPTILMLWCRDRERFEQERAAARAVAIWLYVLRCEAEGLRLVGWVGETPRLRIADPVRAHRFGWDRRW